MIASIIVHFSSQLTVMRSFDGDGLSFKEKYISMADISEKICFKKFKASIRIILAMAVANPVPVEIIDFFSYLIDIHHIHRTFLAI